MAIIHGKNAMPSDKNIYKIFNVFFIRNAIKYFNIQKIHNLTLFF